MISTHTQSMSCDQSLLPNQMGTLYSMDFRQPSAMCLPTVLDYLLHLRWSGLAHSSIKVHLAAISAFLPPVDGASIFSHLTSTRFLRGLANCRQRWQTSPFTIFHKDKVVLQLHPKFLPKLASQFHLNQVIHFPFFYPKPHSSNGERTLHSLHVRCALAFYLQHTRPFRTLSKLCYNSGPLQRACAIFPAYLSLDRSQHFRVLLPLPGPTSTKCQSILYKGAGDHNSLS